MESFFTFLEKRVTDCSSLLCVGLDPHIADLPAPTAEAAAAFCLDLVERTAPYAAAFKPNAAFFEQFGAPGWTALRAGHRRRPRAFAAPGLADPRHPRCQARRHRLNRRGLCPVGLRHAGRARHHPLALPGARLHRALPRPTPKRGRSCCARPPTPGPPTCRTCRSTGRASPCISPSPAWPKPGTRETTSAWWSAPRSPRPWRASRQAAPDLWFLAPGVGAQGGELETALKAGLRRDGRGLLLPVSRAISRAADPGKAAAELRDKIISIQYQLRD